MTLPPLLQALAGQLADALPLWDNWTAVWSHFKGLPEVFAPGNMAQHPSMHVRPCHLQWFITSHHIGLQPSLAAAPGLQLGTSLKAPSWHPRRPASVPCW